MSTPISPPELIMVMGVQRSGTNALFDSLATDKTVRAFPEDIDSAFYRNFCLRPVKELAPLVEHTGGRILLKPISETGRRSLVALREEFRAYSLRFIWIYRDPVNVLHSMQRENWMTGEEIEQINFCTGWCKRNAYALEFQRRLPQEIAIVRYEDVCLDRAVFRKLTRWFGMECVSYFRNDSGSGRRNVPEPAQKKIDEMTSELLAALDATRTFKPRSILRLKERIGLRRPERLLACGVESQSSPHSGEFFSVPARAPASVDGLHFWLNSATICQRNGRITTEVRESGPHGMSAAPVENGPYAFLSLHRRGTLYYPHTKVAERRAGGSGTLTFGVGEDFFLGGFTIFALYRPNVPCYPPYNQERSTLLRIGRPGAVAPAFFLKWEGAANTSEMAIVLSDSGEHCLASTPSGSHCRQQWRLVIAQVTGAGGEISIRTHTQAGTSIRLPRNPAVAPQLEFVLELGGHAPDKEALFYGEIAEIVLFTRALKADETSAVARYLIGTHRL